MTKKPAAMPIFGDAYLADTTHLSTEEHGVYFLLLLAAWRQPDCALPNDDRKLARIAGVSAQKWRSIRATILDFWTVEEDRIFQARQRKEHEWVCKKREASSKSAKARWDNQVPENKESGGMRTQCGRNAPPPPPIPLSNDNGADEDSDRVFWDAAKAYLGKSKSSLIGKWVRDYGKSETAKAITAAQIERAVDPVPYIERCLRKAKSDGWEMPVC